MASFDTNIAKISGQAVYGPDMREAIAQALKQALGLDVDDAVFFALHPITGSANNFMLEIINATRSGS